MDAEARCNGRTSGDMEISFFAKIVIIMQNPPPDKPVSVTLACNTSFIPGGAVVALAT
jgi:hypothetical protein